MYGDVLLEHLLWNKRCHNELPLSISASHESNKRKLFIWDYEGKQILQFKNM